mmetsp:Transcript_16423/g.36289  ORF Transcript_16423/g.36289 Transcript_16423/m.36289 type:complete len:209 (-) Transcript_16423:545-1171(-)
MVGRVASPDGEHDPACCFPVFSALNTSRTDGAESTAAVSPAKAHNPSTDLRPHDRTVSSSRTGLWSSKATDENDEMTPWVNRTDFALPPAKTAPHRTIALISVKDFPVNCTDAGPWTRASRDNMRCVSSPNDRSPAPFRRDINTSAKVDAPVAVAPFSRQSKIRSVVHWRAATASALTPGSPRPHADTRSSRRWHPGRHRAACTAAAP